MDLQSWDSPNWPLTPLLPSPAQPSLQPVLSRGNPWNLEDPVGFSVSLLKSFPALPVAPLTLRASAM